ncbi:MAG: biopolymer transporter ExbD [Burkholderiales bacterium PBB4]|nr:MAG: biopolymer transporter ExbD [Burkholderiales bacterium PBB4]
MAIDFEAQAEDGEHPELAEAEAASSINITPLIDVLLVLLVMLIITIPVHFHAVNIELPNSGPATQSAPPPIVRIEVTASQQIVWNGVALSDRQDLENHLLAAAQFAPPPEIHVHAAPTTKYDSVAAVLSAAQRLGLQKIGVVGLDEYLPTSLPTNP